MYFPDGVRTPRTPLLWLCHCHVHASHHSKPNDQPSHDKHRFLSIIWSKLPLHNCDLHTHTHPFNGPFSRTTRVRRYQKGENNLDFTEARDSGISWAICKCASRSTQITTPASHHSVFTGQMPFLPPNQQRQSTEGDYCDLHACIKV